jgi:homoserine O-succinyltransferase/O-acetyltransferase
MELDPLKIAILDMYQGSPNHGLRGITRLVEDLVFPNEWKIFDVRGKGDLPGTEFDIYISTGGPGSPITDTEPFDLKWVELMNRLWDHNQSESDSKKFVILICHSFQMLAHHWKLAEVNKRASPVYGILPVEKTTAGKNELLLDPLPDTFFSVDSRDFQVIKPDFGKLNSMGAHVLCMEKERPHVPFERAIMGIRFSPEFIGFQFHPEIDEFGMNLDIRRYDRKKQIIESYGEKKYFRMIEHLNDKNKISLTYQSIIPRFLEQSVRALRGFELPSR